MLTVFTAQSIPVRKLRREISELQALFPTESQSGFVVSPVGQVDALQLQLVEAEGTIASLVAKKVVLQKQRKEAKTLMTQFNNSSTELAKLLRDKEKYEISYRKYAESSEQARIDEALKLGKISNISIAQAPTRPFQADKSKQKMILLGGLVGGLVAAIGMAYLRENMDDTLKRPEDIKKKLSIPVLASVPCFGATGEQKKQDIFNIANLDVLPKPSKSDAACADNKQTHVYYDELIFKLFAKEASSLGGQQVVAITSSRAGEGVSTTATCLATNLTRRGRVLMVDMDAFKQQGGSFMELYKDLRNTLALNSGFQSSGKSILPANAEASGNNGFEIVDEIQGVRNKAYNFVILALPSVLDDNSVSMLARLADQAILVIEAERVRWQVLKSVCERLTDAGVVIKGAILNKRKYYIPTWLYRKL
jgi:succinoglycan biosynthesis transport protein ExoP